MFFLPAAFFLAHVSNGKLLLEFKLHQSGLKLLVAAR
jgi:hypothetical protein